MNNYDLQFYISKKSTSNNSLAFFYHFIELNNYSNLVEVIGAVKTIFQTYDTAYNVLVVKNGIPFKYYHRGDF